MIVITGPGRGGTSLLAQLYRELGFDTGGEWRPEVNAGFEDPEVVALNRSICQDLGFAPYGRLGDVPPTVRRTFKAFLPVGLRRRLRADFRRRSPQGHLDHVRWSELPATVERHREQLVEAAARRTLVKDPLFCLTLPVWLGAGADIEHVVATLRPSSASASSRRTSNLAAYSDEDLVRSATVMQLGCLHDALLSHDVPRTVLRFPDWTEDPASLAGRLPFPAAVDPETVVRTFDRIHRPDLVHHRD